MIINIVTSLRFHLLDLARELKLCEKECSKVKHNISGL